MHTMATVSSPLLSKVGGAENTLSAVLSHDVMEFMDVDIRDPTMV